MLRVSSVTAACYSVGHFLNDACASLWFSYLLFYLEYAQKLSPPEAGIVLFCGQLFDALATPTVGLLSDRSRGWPALGLGRRKLWNFFGVIVVVVCFFFIFGTCLPCDAGLGPGNTDGHWAAVKTANFAFFASAFNVGWAAVQVGGWWRWRWEQARFAQPPYTHPTPLPAPQVSHMCMVPELTHDEGERVMLNSARYAFTILANVMVFVASACVRVPPRNPPVLVR